MARNLMTNSALNAAAGMTMLFTGVISSVIAARVLGVEATGLIAFAIWLAATGTMIASLGSEVILTRTLPQLATDGFNAARRRGFTAHMSRAVIVAASVILIIYSLAFWESERMHWASTAPSMLILTGILFALQAIGMLSVNYLIGEQRPGMFLRLTVIASVLQLSVVFSGAWFFGISGAMTGYILGQLVFFTYAAWIIAVPADACGISRSTLVKTSMLLTFQVIIESIFLNRIELLFLQQFHGVHLVGFYAIGLSLANLALQLPVQLTGSLVPYYTEQIKARADGRLPIAMFEDVVRGLAYIALPSGLGVAAIAWTLVVEIFGPDFQPAGATVALLALGAPISVFMQVSTKYLFAMGLERERLTIGIIGGTIMVIGCFALVPFYGAEGAAVARLIVFLAMSLLLVRKMDFEGSLQPMFISLAKIGIAALLCAATAYGISEEFDGLPGLLVAVPAGVVVYCVMLKLLKAVPGQDIAAIKPFVEKLPGKLRPSVHLLLNFLTYKNAA